MNISLKKCQPKPEEDIVSCLDSIVDEALQSQIDGTCQLSESELVYRAVRSIVNTIWKKYQLEGKSSGRLSPWAINNFLKDFSKDQKYTKKDFDYILKQMNGTKDGHVSKYEMAVFILRITSYEKLLKPREFEKLMLGFLDSHSLEDI